MPTVGELINKQPTISSQPRSNNFIGVLADILKPLSNRADKYAINQNVPLVGGLTLAEITGLKGAQGLLDDVSYGAPIVRGGSFQTAQVDPRVLDVAGLVPTVGGLIKGGGMYGKALAKEVGRNINEGTTVGQLLDPRMNMIAYHGSPHSFDKFSMDKIGTGEGAQAYGHGLYFADSPDVAKEYQKMLAGPRLNSDELDRQIKFAKSMSERASTKEARDGYANAAKELEASGGVQGTLYKVDISDDAIPNMLLWDKPLSEQPKAVKKAFKDFVNTPEAYELAKEFHGYKEGMKLSDLPVFKNPIGETLYKNVFRWDNKILQDKGVQGIRYLDAGSRGQGAGTMNTVVFDDSLVKILEKNGKPVEKNLDDVRSKWSKLGVQIDARNLNNNEINISKIIVDKTKRNQGLGTEAMKELIKYADDTGKTIKLSPSTDFGGTSVNRLKDFYKRFGFVENKGKNKDFSISELMYRTPESAK